MATVAKAKTQNKVIVSEGMKIGGKSYSIKDAADHALALYEEQYMMQERMLECYQWIGEFLLAGRSMYPSTKLFGKWVVDNGLSVMSKQDRSDAMFIAENWTKVQQLNKNGKLDSLGVSAIRKRIQAETKPKAPTSAGNVSKGKKASASAANTTTEGKASAELPKPQFNSVDELATFVVAELYAHGFNPTDFAKAFAKARAKA